MQGCGKESAVGEWVAAAAGCLGQLVLPDTGSQVVSVVASKGEDKRQAGKRGCAMPASIAPLQGCSCSRKKRRTSALGSLFCASPEQKNAGEQSLKAFFKTYG